MRASALLPQRLEWCEIEFFFASQFSSIRNELLMPYIAL
jgi:hypothetical protein